MQRLCGCNDAGACVCFKDNPAQCIDHQDRTEDEPKGLNGSREPLHVCVFNVEMQHRVSRKEERVKGVAGKLL